MTATHLIKPSRRLIVKYYLYVVAIFLLVLPLALLALIPGAGWRYLTVFLIVNGAWVVLAALLIPAYVNSLQYELGAEEIAARGGLITHTESIIPYRMVTNAAIKRGPFDRWLGLGTIEIHTAGYSQQVQAEASLSGLENYQQVHEELLGALHRWRQPEASAASREPQGQETTLVRDIVHELRALRQELGRSGPPRPLV